MPMKENSLNRPFPEENSGEFGFQSTHAHLILRKGDWFGPELGKLRSPLRFHGGCLLPAASCHPFSNKLRHI